MQSLIEINPAVCHGRPIVAGTRITVAQILGALAGGDSIEDILEDYPSLTRQGILAALEFAGAAMRFEEAPYDLVPA